MKRWEELIQKHLDGQLSLQEHAELDGLLSTTREAAEAFARAARRDQAIEAYFREERALLGARERIRRASPHRRRMAWAGAAAALLATVLAVTLLRGNGAPPLAMVESTGTALHSGELVRGAARIAFPGETTRIDMKPDAELSLEDQGPGKHVRLHRGSLVADVAPQRIPMVIVTPQAEARVLGTRFTLSSGAVTRLEVTEGRVRLTRLSDGKVFEVGAGCFATTESTVVLPIRNPFDDRFLALYRNLHDPKNGYFSPDGVPYHSVETLIVDAPDYGHLTTSETLSYWILLEAMYGRLTGDWTPLERAWARMEEVLIPRAEDQPNNRSYDASRPATALKVGDSPSDYPVPVDPAVKVGADPLAREVEAAYGSPDLYGMHWLADVDNWYGFGQRLEKINTFQRGSKESVWKTIPHPSIERFAWGGPNGFLDLFNRESSYARQWRYSCAPDADARAIQAMFWASRWAREQGVDPSAILPMRKAARMGDSLRYALRGKYFEAVHGLLGWSYGWGGSLDRQKGWAWRGGSDYAHFGYQNPLAAWALATSPDLRSATPGGSMEWQASLARQVEFYSWLQSREGAIGGGARLGGTDFHGMTYEPHPVFQDPPSNEWFGWQAWSMGRLAEYARVAKDPAAQAIVSRWTAWIRRVVELKADGTYEIPSSLRWSGRPGDLHVEVVQTTRDVGVTASLARTLAVAGEVTLARELLDRMWVLYRDERGVSDPEVRTDYVRFGEPVDLPKGWTGRMPNGEEIKEGSTFLDLRSKYRKDPEFPRAQGPKPEFRYHRFWAQVEVALANAEVLRATP
jgi:ferric-dicitrate binding protein FerR (iron transport regulator)